MKFVEQKVWEIENPSYEEMLKKIERAGRTCYQSKSNFDKESGEKFARMIIKSGHESVIEHQTLTVGIITDRAIANELVRHRIASYSQESTRYCKYENLEFVMPLLSETNESYDDFYFALGTIEKAYGAMIEAGVQPQTARAILPCCLKTEIVATMSIREWRHVLKLRLDKASHPQIRQLMNLVLIKFKEKYPIFFEDITNKTELIK